ncbi:HNH endonuclease [Bacillus velezensis]|nr:HNH endonuclease [Bacillus velezensis]
MDSVTIQLVPSVINNKIPHIGGASDLRGGY